MSKTANSSKFAFLSIFGRVFEEFAVLLISQQPVVSILQSSVCSGCPYLPLSISIAFTQFHQAVLSKSTLLCILVRFFEVFAFLLISQQPVVSISQSSVCSGCPY